MPGGDKTGPVGQGQMTGRGAGFGGGFGSPGYMNPYGGRGFARGRGRGRGMRYGRRQHEYVEPAGAPNETEMELELLRTGVEHLEATLNLMQKQLTQLEEQVKTAADKNAKEKTDT